ncbi:MAG: NADH-quinone oxidoreductase subunit N [Isosphaeraceae bacterium]
MPANLGSFHPRDFFAFAPEICLALMGLVVLLADVLVFRFRQPEARSRAVGRFAVAGALISFAIATLQLAVRFNLFDLQAKLNFAGIDYLSDPDPYLFFGMVANDLMCDIFKIVFTGLLLLVTWFSPTWLFTEDWGEYYALMFWSTVGMMLLTASEEFLTLFLTLETMTICLYLATALETTKQRSAEGALKYFVYGSVSSALFLFGLSMIYGLTGSTHFFAVRQALEPVEGTLPGLAGNIAGATALLLILVGFGFKIAAVPFHMWAPDAYEGAPAPVTAWVATGSKIASFVALLKVLLNAVGPWSNGTGDFLSPGWIGIVAILSAVSMTYGNFAALAQTNLKRMLAYSSIAHAGYMLVGVVAAGVSVKDEESAGAVLFYLLAYSFANLGAFAVAAWLARDKGTEEISDLNGLAYRYPVLACCILLLMLSLIGLPPLAGFFGKLYMFMEALDQNQQGRITLIWLVAIGLLNSVVSAFYYVRVLKAMFLRDPSGPAMNPPPTAVAFTILLGTAVTLAMGISPAPVINVMRAAAVPMLAESSAIGQSTVTTPINPPPAPRAAPSRTMGMFGTTGSAMPIPGAPGPNAGAPSAAAEAPAAK